ncbi:MAG: thioredoxin domain-containing protein [Nitrospiraceae bacterium]|nr:thioredoxin domain-containing protein [Nitrospiraceae bacterium]
MLIEFKDSIRIIFKQYPYKYRDHAYIASQAALAARDQGKFWEMHNMLLQKSPRLDRSSLIQYAKEIGMDVDRFAKDLDTKKHKPQIDRDLKLAMDIDLYNTPTFFINGRKVVGNRPYEYLRGIVKEELARVKK